MASITTSILAMVTRSKPDKHQVRNCVAHDGQRAPIQLVDEKGCVVSSLSILGKPQVVGLTS